MTSGSAASKEFRHVCFDIYIYTYEKKYIYIYPGIYIYTHIVKWSDRGLLGTNCGALETLDVWGSDGELMG